MDVIIVHRLLKNSVAAKQYILMTAAAYQGGLQAAVDFPVTPGAETYEEIGQIKTFVYLPESALETREAQPERQYTSWFYRTKNEMFRRLRTKLAFWGLLKLPKCHNLPVGSDQESPKSVSD